MSDTDNSVDIDNLDAFAQEFLRPSGKDIVEVKEEAAPVVEDNNEDPDEPLDADLVAEGDDETSEAEEVHDDEQKPKKNRKNFQERIDELTAKAKEAERRADNERAEYQRKLAEFEQKLNKPTEPAAPAKADTGPDASATNDKGEPLYPLGEYDPAYLRDLAKYEVKREMEAAETFRKQREQEQAQAAARETQRVAWVGKIEEAEKELPDIREKINSLEGMFTGINPQYGQYLVDVVMSLDNGPQVLHYLAKEPKEARDIVGSGMASATVKLGKLDQLLTKAQAKEEAPKKVTKAPEPPSKITRGTGGQFATREDTDDLEAFSKMYFSK